MQAVVDIQEGTNDRHIPDFQDSQAVCFAMQCTRTPQAMGPVTVNVQPGGYAHVQLCSESVNVMDLAMWQVGISNNFLSPSFSPATGNFLLVLLLLLLLLCICIWQAFSLSPSC